ncbi:MAG TPA: glycosyltransferase family 2 protein [Gaiellaceae bacterium]|nr:glycosyltransferase family 2 protein [Gaiellaceae bacterium]
MSDRDDRYDRTIDGTIRYSFVIPVFNEQETLPELWSRLTAVIDELDGPAEVLFVDDCSADGTRELLLALQRDDPRVRVIRFARNFGHQVAISAGLDFAVGEAVIVMDGDLQDPPEIVPDLVAKWREGFEVVYAVREHRHGESWLKRVTAGAYYRMLQKLSSVEIPVDVGDFRLVDRRALDTFRSMRERNRYVRGMFSWIGFKQTGVEYARAERYAGKPKYSYRKSLRLAMDGLVSFSNVPLRLALVWGFVFSVVSFIAGIAAIVAKLEGAFVVPGWASIVVAVTFLGGIQLMVLGMMGLYVARIYDEVKSRPLYVIREAHGLTPGAAIGPEEPNPLAVIQRT